MLMKTHVIGGVALGLYAAQVLPHDPILLTGAAAFGALLPDIDHAGSTLGRKVPFAAKTIRGIFGHRTFTHSIAGIGGAAWLMSLLPIHPAIFSGVIIGIISHIVLDAITKDGVKLFWPFPIKVGIPLVRTGGPLETFIGIALIILCVYLLAGVLGYQ